MKKIIDIDNEFALMLEKAHYEYFTMKDNVSFLIEQHKDDASFIDSPMFEKYHDKEIAKKIEYENLKDELTKRYVPEDIKAANNYSWQMDFENKQLVLEY